MHRKFYIDEAGDTALFNKKKQPLSFDQDGRSKFFIIVVVELNDENKAIQGLEYLRDDLILDPSLKNIPSIQKTLRHFHCKDDHVAVRRESFNSIIINNYVKNIFAAIRCKKAYKNKLFLALREMVIN